jgi:N-acetylglucosamine-6-phosphate deacetylase
MLLINNLVCTDRPMQLGPVHLSPGLLDGPPPGGEGSHILTRRTHLRGAKMAKPHRHGGEEGTTATLQPQEAEEIWPVPEGPHSVLQEHHQGHTFGLHHSLVRQLHCR